MKGKKIDINEIKNSPYVPAVALFLVIVLVIGVIVFEKLRLIIET